MAKPKATRRACDRERLDKELDQIIEHTDQSLKKLVGKVEKTKEAESDPLGFVIKDRHHAKKTRDVFQQSLEDTGINELLNEGKNGVH